MTGQTPPEEPTSAFEALLADPLEQFDKRSEILASIEAYSKAVPATAGAQQPKSKAVVLYTAAEVKVLTETASRVAYALGRKDAGEEIAAALERCEDNARRAEQTEGIAGNRGTARTWFDLAAGYMRSAEMARGIASQAPSATSDATPGVPGHQEVSEAARSPQEPCGHPTCPCASQEAR